MGLKPTDNVGSLFHATLDMQCRVYLRARGICFLFRGGARRSRCLTAIRIHGQSSLFKVGTSDQPLNQPVPR